MKTKTGHILFFSIAASLLLCGFAYALDFYKLLKNEREKIIYKHGVCKKVTNNGALADYFIPVKYSAEWQSFLANHPPDVSLDECSNCKINGSVTRRMAVDTAGDVGEYTSIQAHAAEPDTTYISYYDSGNRRLKFAKTTDGGITWSVKTLDPAMAAGTSSVLKQLDRNTLVIAYESSSGLRFARSNNKGASWTYGNLPCSIASPAHFDMDFIDKNNIIIAYDDPLISRRVSVLYTNDGGITWAREGAISQRRVKDGLAASVYFHPEKGEATLWIAFNVSWDDMSTAHVSFADMPAGSGRYIPQGHGSTGGYAPAWGAPGLDIIATGTKEFVINNGQFSTGGGSSGSQYAIWPENPFTTDGYNLAAADIISRNSPYDLPPHDKYDVNCYNNNAASYGVWHLSIDAVNGENFYMANYADQLTKDEWAFEDGGRDVRSLVLFVSAFNAEEASAHRITIDSWKFGSSLDVGKWNSVKAVNCRLAYLSYYDADKKNLKFAKVEFPE